MKNQNGAQSSELRTQSFVKSSSILQQKTYFFSVKLIQFIQTFPSKPIFWKIVDQLLRSGTSIGANVHEARSSSSAKEFIRFYEISLRSLYETEYWLNLLKDSQLIPEEKINPFLADLVEICKILIASIKTLKKKNS